MSLEHDVQSGCHLRSRKISRTDALIDSLADNINAHIMIEAQTQSTHIMAHRKS